MRLRARHHRAHREQGTLRWPTSSPRRSPSSSSATPPV